jgi:formyl-CoA transferase
MGPLHGVRVLDLSRILAGPWATQLLADLGADVLKIEKPGSGDDTRSWGPPWLTDNHGQATAESAYFLAANRGKRSLAIDFGQPAGAELVRRLACDSQVLVENFKPGGLAAYGLDWASLRALNPALVYCSISGYGQDGPNAQRAGYDAAIQAEAGLMSITGAADGTPGAGPQKVGVAVVDLLTGMYATTGILAALRHAESSGVGQHIDLALFDTQLSCLANQGMNYLLSGAAPQRLGTAHPNIVPYQVLPTQDGHFMLAVGNDAQFARLCALLGRPDLATDSLYACNASRVQHREPLIALLSTRLQTQTTAHWLQVLSDAGVPCGPVHRIDEVFALPQIAARALCFDLPHRLAGQLPMVANPLKFSATPIEYGQAPPELGADTASTLSERLGLDASQLEKLRHDGVIGESLQ